MSSDPNALERLNRDELISMARQLGAKRPELLTRPELRDEIIRLSTGSEEERRRARGWFGVARDLVASVVGQGLNLPDTADLIRGNYVFAPKAAPPVATVTLAEIYAAQGHVRKALDLLDEVLASEPDHEAARQARQRWAAGLGAETSPRDMASENTEADVLEAGQPEAAPHEPITPEAAPHEPITPEAAPHEPITPEAAPLEPITPEIAPPEPIQPEPGAAAMDLQVHEGTSGEIGRPELTEKGTPERGGVAEASGDGAVARSLDDGAPATPFPIRSEPRKADAPAYDRVFVIRTDVGTTLCCWEVTSNSFERLRASQPGGRLVLRCVEVAPAWDGPVVREQELELDASQGAMNLELEGAGSELRTVLGWRTEGHFAVMAIAAELRQSATGEPAVVWAPPATMSEESWRRAGTSTLARLASRP